MEQLNDGTEKSGNNSGSTYLDFGVETDQSSHFQSIAFVGLNHGTITQTRRIVRHLDHSSGVIFHLH